MQQLFFPAEGYYCTWPADIFGNGLAKIDMGVLTLGCSISLLVFCHAHDELLKWLRRIIGNSAKSQNSWKVLIGNSNVNFKWMLG